MEKADEIEKISLDGGSTRRKLRPPWGIVTPPRNKRTNEEEMRQIKTDEERERLDEIFAQVEAELNRIVYEPKEIPQYEQDELNRKAKEVRLKAQEHNQMVSNVKAMLRDNAYKTTWERVLAEKYVDLYNTAIPKRLEHLGNINTELNMLRNLSKSISLHLEKAERSAKEQDNHHYYKIFAETTRRLLDSL